MSETPCLLVADRDRGTLSILSKALSRAGYRVIETQNGQAALNLPPGEAPEAILLSSRLAGEDGLKTAARLKESLASWTIPVLLLIAPEDRKSGESPQLHGADGWIEIPCPTRQLIEKVEALRVEKQTRDRLQARLRAQLEEGLNQALEATIQQVIQERSRSLVEQLSAGLVDLVEEEARREMQRRVAALAGEEAQGLIAERVRELAAPLVNEVAEDLVSRQVSAMTEDKANALMARFEKQDIPEMARGVVEQTALDQMPQLVDKAALAATKKIVEDLKTQLPPLIESLTAQSLPKIAPQKLGPMVEAQVESLLSTQIPRRVKADLDNEMQASIEPALKKQMGKVVSFGLLILVLSVALSLAVAFLL